MTDIGNPPMTMEALRGLLESLPRVSLANLPTPLEHCPRLSRAVGGPEIYVKRDDLTGIALGGNKMRFLEFLLGEAVARGADCIVSGGAAQSNTGRQIAAACARLELDCYLVLATEAQSVEVQGNLLLSHVLGAHIRMVEGVDRFGSQAIGDQLAADLRKEGRKPYRINLHSGEAMMLAGAGYLLGMMEMHEQAMALPRLPGAIVVTTGSAITQAALALAAKALGLPYRVVGISVRSSVEQLRREIAALATGMAERFGLPTSVSPEEILAVEEYAGEGYGHPTPEGLDAVRLAGRTEGLLLDPIYTGKAMAGLIDLARKGELRADEPVVFFHTGGTPILFARHQDFER